MLTGILSRVMGGRRGAGRGMAGGRGMSRGMGGGMGGRRTQDQAVGHGVRSLLRRVR